MIKDNQKYFNRMHVVIDALVIIVSYVTAWLLRFRTTLFGMPVRTLPVDFLYDGAGPDHPPVICFYIMDLICTPRKGCRAGGWSLQIF